jgi:hypothetical protein
MKFNGSIAGAEALKVTSNCSEMTFILKYKGMKHLILKLTGVHSPSSKKSSRSLSNSRPGIM